jgi:omega-hydroxy-beta-dihydromenaquinone-9 sulfotransferase
MSAGPEIQSQGPAHVAFLVGAGRSGTTLLYKLLCLHPGVAYISNFENRWASFPPGLANRVVAHRIPAKRATWFGRGGNAYFLNRPWLKKAMPTPNEGESIFQRCGLPLTPAPGYVPTPATTRCLRERFERIRRGSGAEVLVSKRTANNRRIPQLEHIFPGAKYVHLVRDGREVTQSLATVEWWDDHTVWWDGRKARDIEQGGEDRLALCARNWVREVNELERQLDVVPASSRIDLRFERLLQQPMVELERVIAFLELPWTQPYGAVIESLRLHPVDSRWNRDWSPQQLETVLREAKSTLDSLGYAA